MKLALLETRIAVDYSAKTRVLHQAALQIQPGEIVGLVGSSGSGKSSLALALLRLLDLKGGRASGEIWFQGRNLMQYSERQMRSVRGKEIAFVPQSPASFLNPAMTMEAQMSEAWKAHRKGSREEIERQVYQAIEQVGLPAERSFLRRYPGAVSVGQAQRVLIAMAILHNPALLIADEPTSSLDILAQADVLHLLARLNRDRAMGILYISHDLFSVAGFCHRVAILQEGHIVEFGETARIFDSPSHHYTRQLIAAMPAAPRFSTGGHLSLRQGAN